MSLLRVRCLCYVLNASSAQTSQHLIGFGRPNFSNLITYLALQYFSSKNKKLQGIAKRRISLLGKYVVKSASLLRNLPSRERERASLFWTLPPWSPILALKKYPSLKKDLLVIKIGKYTRSWWTGIVNNCQSELEEMQEVADVVWVSLEKRKDT